MDKYSYSQINSFKFCQKQYYLQYVEGKKQYSDSLLVGNIMHEAIELLQNVNIDEIFEWAKARLDTELPTNLIIPKTQWKNNLQNMLNALSKLDIEGKKNIEVEGEIYKPFVGYIDLLSSNGQVIDFKFRKKYRTPDPLQIFIYGELARQNKISHNSTGKIITIDWGGGIFQDEYILEDPTEEVKFWIDYIEDYISRGNIESIKTNKCLNCAFKNLCWEEKNE